jgi:hypothetical protein
MSGRLGRFALVAASLLLLAGGCGDDDDGDGTASRDDRASARGEGPSRVLKDAVAKTEAAGTARMTIDLTLEGGQSTTIDGEGLVDFEHDRDLLTLTVAGRTLQLFSDKGEEYVREGTSGRFRRFPASAGSPVENNPADSLRYVGTDVVDVKKVDASGCYEGRLDFDRIFKRVEPGRDSEFPDELRGERAPVMVCIDRAGRIRRYDVELSIALVKATVRSTLSNYGRAPALEPLGADERPR